MAGMICDATVGPWNQDCAIFKVNETNINVYTKNRLTDEQMQDLYWVCSLMTKTGLTLKDLFKDTISSNDARNLMYYTSKDKSKEEIEQIRKEYKKFAPDIYKRELKEANNEL